MITIQAEAIRMTYKFASKDAARLLLRSVYLAPGAIVVSTDGKVLASFREGHDADESMMIPTTKEVMKVFRRVSMVSNEDPAIVTQIEDGKFRIEGNGAFAEFHPVEGTYPNFEKVFPGEQDAEDVGEIRLRPDQLALFHGVCRFRFHGPRLAVMVTTDQNERFVGLIMPFPILD